MSIKKVLKEILNPRLTTQDMENSQTRCGCDHQILSMYFDDNRPNFPTHTLGCINTGQGWKILSAWNQYGECMVNCRRIKSFDLVTSSQKEINEAKPVMIGMLCLLLIIILSMLIS